MLGGRGRRTVDPNETAAQKQARVDRAIVASHTSLGLNDEVLLSNKLVVLMKFFGTITMVLDKDGGLKASVEPDDDCVVTTKTKTPFNLAKANQIHDDYVKVKAKAEKLKTEISVYENRAEVLARSKDIAGIDDETKKICLEADEKKKEISEISLPQTALNIIKGVEIDIDSAPKELEDYEKTMLPVSKELKTVLNMKSEDFRTFRQEKIMSLQPKVEGGNGAETDNAPANQEVGRVVVPAHNDGRPAGVRKTEFYARIRDGNYLVVTGDDNKIKPEYYEVLTPNERKKAVRAIRGLAKRAN